MQSTKNFKSKDDVQYIIENVTNFMNETHPLSAAYLAVTRTTSLLRHSDNTTRIMEIRDEVSSAQNRLKEFIRFNAINISYLYITRYRK